MIIRIQYTRPKNFKGKLNPLESALFDHLILALPKGAQELLRNQLQKPLSGARLYFQRSYSLELYVECKDFAFPRKDGSALASISFNYGGQKYTATFPTHLGNVSGIKVRPSPKHFLNKSGIEILVIKIPNDPMIKIDLNVDRELFGPNDELPQLLKTLASTHKISNVWRPLSEDQRQLFIKLHSTKIPDDYLELTKAADGFEIDELQVYGLAEMEIVSMDDGDYLKLIESEVGVLTVKQNARAVKLIYFSFEDETVKEEMGESFIGALNKMLGDE